jgi:hypothetical protein
MSKTTAKSRTVYDVPAVAELTERAKALDGKLSALVAAEMQAGESRHDDSIADEAARLLRGEPTQAAPKINYARERAVIDAARAIVQRELSAAIIEASRLECESRRAEHCELVADIAHALDAVKQALDNEAAFRRDLSNRGFRDFLPAAFGSESAVLGRALSRFDLEVWHERLVRIGVQV